MTLKNGTQTILGGFCDKAILENNWNVLDVSANGSLFQFRINGYLMWQGTNTSFSSGRVGLFNFSYDYDGTLHTFSTHDRFEADYFWLKEPVNIASEEVRMPDPSLEVGENPFEIR